MITKKQRQSSRSYQERLGLAAQHHARAPQIYTKELHTGNKSFLSAVLSLSILKRLFRRKAASKGRE